MKKLILCGSSKLPERAAYWRGYFEGRGYEVIDYPAAVPFDTEHAAEITDIYSSYYQNLDRADVLFLMNEDKNNIGGYIGPSAMSELTYAVVGNLNRGKKMEILLLQKPSEEQPCSEEINFWLAQDWVKIYDRPTGKKAAIPVPAESEDDSEEDAEEPTDQPETVQPVATSAPQPAIVTPKFHRPEKTINIRTCRKRCLRHLNSHQREYLSTIAPEFPAWLLKYIAAPEFQRLHTVSMACGFDHSSLFTFQTFHSVYAHSIGVALILWRFTRDKKQTLAGLFHDIAAPAFKHCIDVMNGDSENQESIEEHTSEIIRNSRTITRQLKKDGIMAGEISDYRLYPLADNSLPNLAADRLEYTLSDGYFLYDAWTLEQVKRFMDNIIVLKNENDIDELGFRSIDVCKEFTLGNLTLSANYHDDNARATAQFIADILKSMMLRDYLTMDDLYAMSEREIIDWILSCGDKTLSEAFRQFQRATTVYSSTTAKKDRYCTNVKLKVHYIIPLVQADEETGSSRITELSKTVNQAVIDYLDQKPSKYTGFDFEFKPYTE